MKNVIIKRKPPVKMVTIIVYNPVKQEYMLLPTAAGSIAKLQAAVSSQYPVEERGDIHIVTVLEGICASSAVYETEVATVK